MILAVAIEAGKIAAKIVEDPVIADGSWRIPCVESDQGFEMFESFVLQIRHCPGESSDLPFARVHSEELWPNSLMKPSASVTDQSAD